MRLLLDTNILIPLLRGETGKLPAAIRRCLSLPDANFLVSAASIWEIAIKFRSGKLAFDIGLDEIPLAFDQLQLDPLLITFNHALAELADPPLTRDPFDRLLLAQCQVEDLRLVTIDQALETHPLAWRES